MKRQLWGSIVGVVLALGLTACGEGMTSVSFVSNGNGSAGVPAAPTIDMDSIEVETKAAEDAMAEAEAALDEALGQSSAASEPNAVSVQSLTGLPERLEEALNNVYDKITLPVQKAKAMINIARGQLAAVMAKLDPANPAHADAIRQVQEAVRKLDAMEARLTGVYKMLATKIDVVLAALDRVIARLDNGNPLLLIPLMELQELRQVIVDFQTKLANT
jgi:hypothetical protein